MLKTLFDKTLANVEFGLVLDSYIIKKSKKAFLNKQNYIILLNKIYNYR